MPNFMAQGKGAAQNTSSAIEAWSLLFSDDLLNLILKYTNQEIERKRDNSCNINRKSRFRALDVLELKAFIGLLYYASLAKKRNAFLPESFSIHSLFLFRAVMSKTRYEFLLSHLRFDDIRTRDEHKNDYFVSIRKIWNLFITNCIRYYEPGYNVTIDEYRLNVYDDIYDISHNEHEHEIKVLTMNDSDTFYMINAILRIANARTELLGSYYVKKISKPIHNTNRNMTCRKNWLLSVSSVEDMIEKFSLTIVGSLKKSKCYIPPLFKRPSVERKWQFAYQNNKTLVSYKSENDKMILLLSSLHLDGKINKMENKPEIISYYDKTKRASNKFVQLCHEYAVNETYISNLPIQVFCAMLDQAVVNSFILYTLNANNQTITRDKFLLELSMALTKPFLIEHLSQPDIKLLLKFHIKYFLNEQNLEKIDLGNLRLDSSHKLKNSVNCTYCTFFNSKIKTTRFKCTVCNTPTCTDHIKHLFKL